MFKFLAGVIVGILLTLYFVKPEITTELINSYKNATTHAIERAKEEPKK